MPNRIHKIPYRNGQNQRRGHHTLPKSHLQQKVIGTLTLSSLSFHQSFVNSSVKCLLICHLSKMRNDMSRVKTFLNLELTSIMNIIDVTMFEEVNQKLTDMYIFHTKDMRKCPNPIWNNAGFIDLKPCSKRAQCNACEFKWREIAQMTFLHKLSKHVSEGVKLKSDHLSYFNEVCYGNACPGCSSIIFKNGGWPHMICQKCGYEFWWSCLTSYRSYM